MFVSYKRPGLNILGNVAGFKEQKQFMTEKKKVGKERRDKGKKKYEWVI